MPIQAPQWTDYLNCPVCCREFGPPPRSPVSLGCGHTLCRHCLKHLHRKQCPFDQTLIQLDLEDLVTNTAILQLAGYAPPAQPFRPPCILALPEQDRHSYDVIIRSLENLAVYLKHCGTANNSVGNNRLSRPMQRKLITVIQCAMTDEEGRGRAARAARSLGERTVTELILQHQNPQQLSANLWAAVRARGCQFLGPAMQEEVLKLVLLALEDGSALSRKVLVMFVVQRLEPHFPQASKTSIGHVVQLLYRASCFKVSKRESDSSLMQLKEEFRSYESLRREHDAQIVQIATEAGLRIAPDQWSSLLYGDTVHKSHMQSIIDKLQTPASFGQSVQELFIALQRSGDPAQLVVLSLHLDRLASIEPAPDAKSPPWNQLAEIMSSLNEVVARLINYLQQQATVRDVNHNAKHLETKAATPATGGSTPTHTRYKVSMCRDATQRSFCPRGNSCTFAHTEEELERFRSVVAAGMGNGNYSFLMPPPPAPMPPPPPKLPIFTRFPMPQHHGIPDNYNMSQLATIPAASILPPQEMLPNPESARAADNNQAQSVRYHGRGGRGAASRAARKARGRWSPSTWFLGRMPRGGRGGGRGQPRRLQENMASSFPARVMRPPAVPAGLGRAQNGAPPTPAPPPDRYFPRFPHQYEAPTTSSYKPVVDAIPAALPPGIVVNYANKEPDVAPFTFDEHPGEARQEMMPMFRMNAFPPPSQPLERHPGNIWPPMFNFDGMVNALPRQNANDDVNMFNDRRKTADFNDDQELEEELQALERRIDTEFKSTD